MNTLCQAVDDYLELRRGLGFKLVNYGVWLREFVSFLEQKKCFPDHDCFSGAVRDATSAARAEGQSCTDTLPCAVLRATESVSILQPRFLRVV